MKNLNEKKFKILGVGIFVVAMAYLEATVVVYLRALYYPEGFFFPLKMIPTKMAFVEVGREVATIVMLFSIAFIVGKKLKDKAAYFFLSFGIWDIFYYVWLWVLLRWPGGFFDLDLLFLIPVPWIGPVAAPILISILFITVALLTLTQDEINFSSLDLFFEFLAVLMVILSFTLNYTAVFKSPMVYAFPWWFFFPGVILGVVVFIRRLLVS